MGPGARLNMDPPVIVEGIFILETLDRLDFEPDYLVLAEMEGWEGSHTLFDRISSYRHRYADPVSGFQVQVVCLVCMFIRRLAAVGHR